MHTVTVGTVVDGAFVVVVGAGVSAGAGAAGGFAVGGEVSAAGGMKVSAPESSTLIHAAAAVASTSGGLPTLLPLEGMLDCTWIVHPPLGNCVDVPVCIIRLESLVDSNKRQRKNNVSIGGHERERLRECKRTLLSLREVRTGPGGSTPSLLHRLHRLALAHSIPRVWSRF